MTPRGSAGGYAPPVRASALLALLVVGVLLAGCGETKKPTRDLTGKAFGPGPNKANRVCDQRLPQVGVLNLTDLQDGTAGQISRLASSAQNASNGLKALKLPGKDKAGANVVAFDLSNAARHARTFVQADQNSITSTATVSLDRLRAALIQLQSDSSTFGLNACRVAAQTG